MTAPRKLFVALAFVGIGCASSPPTPEASPSSGSDDGQNATPATPAGDTGDAAGYTYTDLFGHEHHVIETLMVEAKDGKTYKVACRPPGHHAPVEDVFDNTEKVGTIMGGDSFETTTAYARFDLDDLQQRFRKAGGGCRPALEGPTQK